MGAIISSPGKTLIWLGGDYIGQPRELRNKYRSDQNLVDKEENKQVSKKETTFVFVTDLAGGLEKGSGDPSRALVRVWVVILVFWRIALCST